jgi:hypothetical protein
MNLQKYIGSTGLGLLPDKVRRELRAEVLKARYTYHLKSGMSRKQARDKALSGYADGGMPNYQHRSFVADVFPVELLPAKPFKFTNNLSDREAQKVIDDYLERYPSPRRFK